MKTKFFIVTLLCLLTTGCWNYRELNEVSIVTGMGVDKENDLYTVTLMIANTEVDSANDEAKTSIVTGNGYSLTETMKDLELKIPDSIYLGHLSVLVIAEKLASDGIKDILDYVINNYDINRNHFLVLAKDNKAEEVLRVISPLDTFPSQTIVSSVRNTSKNQGITTNVYFNDFVANLVNQGVQGVLPSIYVDGNMEQESNNETSTESIPSLKIGPLGIFRGSKLIGWADENVSRGINIINNQTDNIFVINNYNNGKVIVSLSDLKCLKKVVFRNGKAEIDIEVNAVLEIEEVTLSLSLNDDTINDITKKSSNNLNDIVLAAVLASKEYKTDILGLGNIIYKKNYKYWYDVKNDWNFIGLNDVKVNVSSKVDLSDKNSLKNILKEK